MLLRRVTTLLVSVAVIAFGGLLVGHGNAPAGLVFDLLGVVGLWASIGGWARD